MTGSKKAFDPKAFKKAQVSSEKLEARREFLAGAGHRVEELGPDYNNDPELIQQELEAAHKKKLAWSHAPSKGKERDFLAGGEHRDESFGSDYNNDPEELQKAEKGKYKRRKKEKGPSRDY